MTLTGSMQVMSLTMMTFLINLVYGIAMWLFGYAIGRGHRE
jgi:hypothetical protein